MNRLFLLLLPFVLLSAPEAAEKEQPPGIAGLCVGMSRTALLDTLSKSPAFKAAEIAIDSNAVMVSARGREVLRSGKAAFSSVKCMFNKKKEIQALSFVFPAQTVDAVQAVYGFATEVLGEPESASGKKAGFGFEAEWRFSRYAATFFASDRDFEAYLLIAFGSFVREEELRGKRHPQ